MPSVTGSFFSRLLGYGEEEEDEEDDDDDDDDDDDEGGSFFGNVVDTFLDYAPLDDMASEAVESILDLFDCDDEEESAKHVQKLHKAMSGVKSENANKPAKSIAGKSKEEKHDSLAEYALDALDAFKHVFPDLSDEAEVPEEVLSDERTHLEDAGLVMNSPYVAALRPDRKVKLILSFDFSAGDPFMTVTQAAEHCKQTGIPFPPVDISEEDRMQPKDFYVFKSESTPTVIHIPLFNIVNCEACWFELSPHEVGYSHIGAFVGTSSSRSKFEVGVLKQKTAEKDMLYLQGYSSSGCLADTDTDEEEGDTLDDMATEMAESLLQLFDCEDDEEGHKLLEKMHRVRYHIILDAEVPEEVLSKERTHLEDAGLVMNSPYVAALRPDRKVKLILSFDFSAGDPFMTVTQAAEQCKQTGIPFPPVEISKEDTEQPKDLYVFKSENTPTVIHIPLFNMVNCEGDVAKWSQKYKTFRFAYDRETLDDLIRVSGLNVANNKKRILREISVCK
ncbi:hypothetical protein SKAU_G00383690 [Synaphobranchus kaupii]|uniref:PLA2c domain-containing protein n=1 Tax=Synaphobranchus kaupii TaxID=118154 RepID=A0A9Q1EE37_SYNKA|nr:hypothetical protein SKAU_G00383690 [Synaphobranchus kaupii]